jgi:hypothetical protein
MPWVMIIHGMSNRAEGMEIDPVPPVFMAIPVGRLQHRNDRSPQPYSLESGVKQLAGEAGPVNSAS